MSTDLFDLNGKVAIVTGGNGGLGLGMAKGLAGAGADIMVTARNPDKTKKAVAEIKALGVRAEGLFVDLLEEASIKAMVTDTIAAFGRVDILINNGGIVIRNSPQNYTIEEWNQVLKVNLTAGFLCAKEVYPHMIKQGGGKIINIGSIFSLFGAEEVMPYAVSKGGVVLLTKSLAVAWAKDNVQVNAILPGWIQTDMTEPLKDRPERRNAISVRIPQGRFGDPTDLAGAAVFLASAASNFVTGAALPVDGGYSSY